MRKGYGVAVMTNGEGGGAVMRELQGRVAAACGWDVLDKPLVAQHNRMLETELKTCREITPAKSTTEPSCTCTLPLPLRPSP